jgi:hypothetical protein
MKTRIAILLGSVTLAGICCTSALGVNPTKGDTGASGEKTAAGEWQPLWNGKDFSGFRFQFGAQGTENNGTFTVKDDTILISGKPAGYLYTERS